MSHSLVKDLFYSYFPSNKKYLTFSIGETNIILSAPHGGGIRPVGSVERTYGNRSKDIYTRRLIQRIIELSKKRPYYIYADIHRSIVDLNRNIEEAAQGNPLAEDIWGVWNATLGQYTNSVEKLYRRGLYIDIHSHDLNSMFELGYGLKVRDYINIKNGLETDAKSTMYSKNFDQKELLFGDHSFEHNLEFYEYKVLTPISDDKYLNGGWNIRRNHGSAIQALQIECPIQVLRRDLEGVARAITNSIEIFKERFLDDKVIQR